MVSYLCLLGAKAFLASSVLQQWYSCPKAFASDIEVSVQRALKFRREVLDSVEGTGDSSLCRKWWTKSRLIL